MKKILLLCLVLAIAMMGAKAQIGGGFDFAMNFGGGGFEVSSVSIGAANNIYFNPKITGAAKFARQDVGTVSTKSYPILTNIIDKISSNGTQTLIKNMGSANVVKATFAQNGDIYAFILGSEYLHVDLGSNIILNETALYLVKIDVTGAAKFAKKMTVGRATMPQS